VNEIKSSVYEEESSRSRIKEISQLNFDNTFDFSYQNNWQTQVAEVGNDTVYRKFSDCRRSDGESTPGDTPQFLSEEEENIHSFHLDHTRITTRAAHNLDTEFSCGKRTQARYRSNSSRSEDFTDQLSLSAQKQTDIIKTLQNIIQRRSELKHIDQQLFEIMSQNMIELELAIGANRGPSSERLPDSRPRLGFEQHNFASPTDTAHSAWPPGLGYGHQGDCMPSRSQQTLDDAVDLTQTGRKEVSDTNTGHSANFAPSAEQICPGGPMLHGNKLSEDGCQTDKPRDGGVPVEVGLVPGRRKSLSVNLKKSRLLEALAPTYEDEQTKATNSQAARNSSNSPRLAHQQDQTSPLSLLKRYRTPPPPPSALTRTSKSSAGPTSPLSLPRSAADQEGEHLRGDHCLKFLQHSVGLIPQPQQQTNNQLVVGSPIGSPAPALVTSGALLTPVTGGVHAAASDPETSHHRPNNKKFRSLSYSSFTGWAQPSIASHNHDSEQMGARIEGTSASAEELRRQRFRDQQQQYWLSEYAKQQASVPPRSLSLLANSTGVVPNFEADANLTNNIGYRSGYMHNITADQTAAYFLSSRRNSVPMNRTIPVSFSTGIQNNLFNPKINLELLCSGSTFDDHRSALMAASHKIAFRCHVCGSRFEDRHRLQQHLSIHLNLHPSWFEERTIKETMAQYESKRGDYLCQTCNLRFDTTTEFDKHMQVHGEKPHHCDLCNQDNKIVSFRYYRQLLTHLRSHCFLYSCRFVPDCKQTANRKDYLKLHILKHHLNNKLPEQHTICCQ